MTTIILTTDQVKARLIELLAGQVTPRFISVKNYRNEQGEVSNYVINLAVDHMKSKLADIETLSSPNCITGIDFGNLAPLANKARIALLEAMQKPTIDNPRAMGQINAYTQLCANIRLHDETGKLFVHGVRISKTVLVKGNYKAVNHQPLTIVKDKIRKQLKTDGYRQFGFDKLVEIRMNGETLEFDC